jgi:hypothetical protein
MPPSGSRYPHRNRKAEQRARTVILHMMILNISIMGGDGEYR